MFALLTAQTATTTPQIDSTITISAIVAIAAIISPIFTALINNWHATKIKRLELKQKQYENTVMYERHLFENYLKYAGRCILFSDVAASKDYGEYYFSALMCAPENIRNKMITVNKFMQKHDFDKATTELEELTTMIHAMLQTK